MDVGFDNPDPARRGGESRLEPVHSDRGIGLTTREPMNSRRADWPATATDRPAFPPLLQLDYAVDTDASGRAGGARNRLSPPRTCRARRVRVPCPP
ncbi:hypothetical protein OHT61_00970 [Streptomyces sp. NBC_00178]|uniref:hypothetical protein n=1 Tax=Streptomyces sp. NBC_00178 TaxID=2975672 RepID=UPI002E2E713F|nr:hypothetical protein [Streptomyces sp. NBC_00178]